MSRFARPFLLSALGTLVAAVLNGCAARPVKRLELDRIHVGMDKGQVLELVGNPKRTFHSEGRDHWTYQFYEYEREMLTQIDFRDGHVVKVGQPSLRRGFVNTLENAESMEDYERAVKDHQKKSSGFQDVPGGEG